MIRGVAFDWDGVISDSGRLQVLAEQEAARTMAGELGLSVELETRDWAQYQGWGRTKIAQAVLGLEEADPLCEEYRERVVDTTLELLGPETLQPIEGAQAFVERRLRDVGKLAVATSSNRLILDASIGLFDMQDVFETTVAHRESARDKPHPDQYLEIADRLNINPGELLVIEDSKSGIDAGLAAGAFVLALTTTKPMEYLRTHTSAHLVVQNFHYAERLIKPRIER